MNTHETIFRRAILSGNPQAILNVAHAFTELGEQEKADILIRRMSLFRGIQGIGGTCSKAWFFGGTSYVFGVDYAAVQKKLNDLGAKPALDVDGKWGPKSKTALITYQKGKGLSADGVPGPITLGAMGIKAANETASSTMGNVVPSANSADARAYNVGKKAGVEIGLTDKEVQYVVTVARGEGGYGAGWAHPSARTIELSKKFGLTGYEGANSNNWGAVQGSGNAGNFPHVDVHADGSGYRANYRKYTSPEEGFKDMARIILGGGKRKAAGAQEIKSAIATGNLRQAVFAQHANGYFELKPESYLSAVMSNYNKIMNGVGWPKVLAENGITPTIAAAAGGGGLLLGLGLTALGIFMFRKPLGLVA